MEIWQPTKREAVLDGDLLVYAAAAKFNNDSKPDAAFKYIENELLWHRDALELDDFQIFTTAGGNFRKELSDTYKANRQKTERPQWLVPCYKYLAIEWKSYAERGYEADDLLAIAITENPDMLLVSYDKDLNQVPGWHYDWRKYSLYYVTPEEGDYFLARQMLQGDPSDNIKGVKGIGPKKADKLLEGVATEALLPTVLEIYKTHDMAWDEFRTNYQLLKILRSKEMKWPELDDLHSNSDSVDAICGTESVPV